MADQSKKPTTRLAQISTTAQIDETEPYYAALGKFIVAYAVAEGGVHRLARRLAGLSDAKGRILFGGSRIGDVQSRARGLLKVVRCSTEGRLAVEASFKQFDQIGTQRDKLVHRFVDLEGGAFVVSNYLTAKSFASIEQDIISKEDLHRMESDCWLIFGRLERIRNPGRRKRDNSGVRKWLKSPWLYKPAQQQTPKRQTRAQEIAALLIQPPPSQG